MAIISKYSTEEVEQLLNQVLSVVEAEQVKPDLALMVLGNAATHIIQKNLAPEQQANIAEQFSKALKASLPESPKA